MPRPNVNWYAAAVTVRVNNAMADVIDGLAFQIEARAKINITDNAQVDTGFMRSSVYVVSSKSNTFGSIDASGDHVSSKTNRTVQRQAVPNPPDPPKGGAIVGVAAEYAVYLEMEQSFLMTAAEQAASDVGAVVSRVEL